MQSHIFRSQTRGMGLGMTEHLRDKLRPAWLRVRPPDEPDDESPDARRSHDGPTGAQPD